MTINETGRGWELHFDFRPTIVEEVKKMHGARFMGKQAGWFIPVKSERKENGEVVKTFHNREAMEKFKKKYLVITPGSDAPEQLFKVEELPELKVVIPWRENVQPFAYQARGIAAGMALRKFINADQPGLGKTFQTIGTILGLQVIGQPSFPCLVICPSTLRENWRREWEEKFTYKKALILSDQNKNTWHQYHRMGMADVFIVNYESLKKYFVIAMGTKKKGEVLTLKDIQFNPTIKLFKSVIFDESHRLKDPTTIQTKLCRGIAQGKETIIELTGTPVVNKPRDLASQLAIIEQLGRFGSYKFFMDRYCEGGNGQSNLGELNGMLNKYCFFRREKKDVLQDLPDKMREVITCDITTREEYNLAAKDLKKYLESQGYTESQVKHSMNGEIMVQIGKLKAISARGKLPEAIEHIQEVVDAGEKIVVFIHQKFMADALLKQFPDAVTVRGQEIGADGKERPQGAESRQLSVDRFQNDPNVKVIICSIKAAGVGITLTASSRLVFLELPWHPADVEQCEDRIHRIGQENSAQITYFLGKGTIDEDIYKLIEEKRKVSDAITGTTTDINTIITDLSRSLFNQK